MHELILCNATHKEPLVTCHELNIALDHDVCFYLVLRRQEWINAQCEWVCGGEDAPATGVTSGSTESILNPTTLLWYYFCHLLHDGRDPQQVY